MVLHTSRHQCDVAMRASTRARWPLRRLLLLSLRRPSASATHTKQAASTCLFLRCRITPERKTLRVRRLQSLITALPTSLCSPILRLQRDESGHLLRLREPALRTRETPCISEPEARRISRPQITEQLCTSPFPHTFRRAMFWDRDTYARNTYSKLRPVRIRYTSAMPEDRQGRSILR